MHTPMPTLHARPRRACAQTLLPLVLALLLVPLIAAPATAQDEDGDFRGRKRVEEWRKIKLIEAVELTEEQSLRYFAREREFRQAERKLGDERAAALERLRALTRGTPDDAELQKEIAAVTAVHQQLLTKRTEFVTGLRDILSMKQIAKLLVFEDSFARELRELLRKPRGDGGWRR